MPQERLIGSCVFVWLAGEFVLAAAPELVRVLEPRLGQDDRELVTADPAGDVGCADETAEPACKRGEDGVPCYMVVLVVDLFEVVDVEHDQRERMPIAAGPCELACQRVSEEAVVVEAGQAVAVDRLTHQATLFPRCVMLEKRG